MNDLGTTYDVDVLVVGVGPTGATLALALAQQGIKVCAVNKYNWVSQTPRAHITNLRAMEVLRALGVEKEVVASGIAWESMGDTSFSTGLSGTELARLSTWGTGRNRYGDYLRASPCTMLDIPQSMLEPILVNAAAKHGAVFSFNTEYLGHTQDAEGVTVKLRNRLNGQTFTQRARYLVGADGAKSQVLQDLGLEIEGQPARDGTIYVEFKADLASFVAHRPSILHWILSPDATRGDIGMAVLRAIRPWNHWIAGWVFEEERGQEQLSTEHVLERIYDFVGDRNIDCEIVGISTWFVNEQHAPIYSKGRVFCGGDAVHRHPPSGGMGSNTCIQDAFNLAWKLAFVAKGWADPSLLETYTKERAPVGRQIVARANQCRRDYAPLIQAIVGEKQPDWLDTTLNLIRDAGPEGAKMRANLNRALELKDREFNGMGAEMNHRYLSSAILNEPEEEVFEQDPVLHLKATTRPGAKLPHCWLVDGKNRRVSSLDIVSTSHFTLLTELSGEDWAKAAAELNPPWLKTVVIGQDAVRDLYFDWRRNCEIAEGGALLVRPDGVVAWRAPERAASLADAKQRLAEALKSLLGHSEHQQEREALSA